MKYFDTKILRTLFFAVICFLIAGGNAAVQAQTPTSGAMLTITGTVATSPNPTPVHLVIYDSQIHSGVVLGTGCDPNFPTDAYVLQGGSWTGCDNGDAHEVTDGPGAVAGAQSPGKADLTGAGYSFHIETHYLFSVCNTSGTICASPDNGFLTVTNMATSAFTGTITLQGTSPIHGGAACPANGNAFDNWATGLTANGSEGDSVRLALGAAGSNADSSNCGGFNAPQTLVLTQGVTTKFQIGNDDFEITPAVGGTGDSLTVLPIPVPAGPLSGSAFGNDLGLSPLGGVRFSATNFPGQASIPYADFSAAGNPVGLEFQLSCTGADCNTFIYTAQTDFTIDHNSFPTGIGGPHFLGQHEGIPADYNGSCPTTGFTVDIFLAYTGGVGDPPLLGSSDGTTCFVGTFDPNATAVPAGTVVKSQTLVGFQRPVEDDEVNEIEPGQAVPLIWKSFDSFGNPVTNLSLCNNLAGVGCNAPWVFIGTTAISCKTHQVLGSPILPAPTAGKSGLDNDGNGLYEYVWKTPKTGRGCVTPVFKFSSGLISFGVANFKFDD